MLDALPCPPIFRRHILAALVSTIGMVLLCSPLVAFSSEAEIDAASVDEVLSEMRWSVQGLRDSRAREERKALLVALEETGGNVTRTAKLLGRSRAAVYRMVERHGVPLRRACCPAALADA